MLFAAVERKVNIAPRLGGLATMLIFPPLGLLSIAGWFLWVIADLFLIPCLCRRTNEDRGAAEIFS